MVHLEDGRLPELDRWEEQFAASANGSCLLRGVESSSADMSEPRTAA